MSGDPSKRTSETFTVEEGGGIGLRGGVSEVEELLAGWRRSHRVRRVVSGKAL